MADFCTIADIEAFLQIEIPAEKLASAERAIDEATAAIKNYSRQIIEAVAEDVMTFDVAPATSRLFLPEMPVTEVIEVVEDGETLTEGADEDYQLGQWGILHRIGQFWYPGIQTVAVTYAHGYATIPQDIKDVATRAAARAYQAGLRAAELEGIPGVVSTSLGDYAVSFGSEATGGIGEGVLGASAARMLLLSEKDVLNTYRLKGI